MQYERFMGIDYGRVRIGIAFSDLMGILATAYETYVSKSPEKDIEYLSSLISEKEIRTVIIGFPLNMDGTEGERAVRTREFAEALKEKTGVNIVYQDERLSSVEAEDILIEAGIRREKRKNLIDKVAASLILQSYLDSKKRS